MHPFVAWAPMHALWHAPQFAMSEAICDSQPSSVEALQSEKPALHAPIEQVPVEHVAAAFAKTHA